MLNGIQSGNGKNQASFSGLQVSKNSLSVLEYSPWINRKQFGKIKDYFAKESANGGKDVAVKFKNNGFAQYIAAQFKSMTDPAVQVWQQVKLNSFMPLRSVEKLMAEGQKALALEEAAVSAEKVIPINIGKKSAEEVVQPATEEIGNVMAVRA